MVESFRNEKLIREISRQAAIFVGQNSNGTSLITVTNVVISNNAKTGKVFVSVLPVHKEKAAMDFLKRQQKEFSSFLQKNIKTGQLPRLSFELDLGEKNRQRIEEISKKS
ncbi:MAG: ribosome-binding factor A [Patescibacteria group bacterium]